MKTYHLVLVALFLCLSCSMPATRIYSLSLPEQKIRETASTGASMQVSVRSSRYLSQPYIAWRTSPYQIEISRYAKWDSPPEEIMKEALKDSLCSLGMPKTVSATTAQYILEINLKKFERVDSETDALGEIAFTSVLLSTEGKELSRTYIAKKVKLEEKTSLGLAKALSAALTEALLDLKSDIIKNIK